MTTPSDPRTESVNHCVWCDTCGAPTLPDYRDPDWPERHAAETQHTTHRRTWTVHTWSA